MSFPPPSKYQARILWMAMTGLAIAVLVGLLVALMWGLGRVLNALSPVLWPLAFAGVLAYLMDPVVDFIERKGASRARAIVLVMLLAFFIVGGLVSSVVPQLVSETTMLVRAIPAYAQLMEKRVQRWLANPPGLIQRLLEHSTTPPPTLVTNAAGDVILTNGAGFPALTNGHSAGVTNPAGVLTNPPGAATRSEAVETPVVANAPAIMVTTNAAPTVTASRGSTNQPPILDLLFGPNGLQAATGWLTTALPKVGSWLAGQAGRVFSWFGFVAGLALVPVYLFYFLLEKQAISSHWTNYLPVSDSRFKEELVFVLGAINNYLIAFFRGQVLVAICDAILYTIGFMIIDLPYAILLGAAAVFLTIIPYIGAFLIFSAALLIALFTYGDWLHPLLVVGVFVVVQALEGFVIAPKILGDRVGLHPVTIIIAVVVGTSLLGGLLGGVLAIPLTAALRVLMFRYVWRRPSEAVGA